MLRIVILLQYPSKSHTSLSIGQYRIFQDIFEVESGHSVGNSMYRTKTVPRAAPVPDLFCKANLELLGPEAFWENKLVFASSFQKCYAIF